MKKVVLLLSKDGKTFHKRANLSEFQVQKIMESGLVENVSEEKAIELLMAQTGCNRTTAIETLHPKENDTVTIEDLDEIDIELLVAQVDCNRNTAVETFYPKEDDTITIEETDLYGKDIELVMTQAGCNRATAIHALRQKDGDIVDAIMSLSE